MNHLHVDCGQAMQVGESNLFHEYIVLHATNVVLMHNFTSLAFAFRTHVKSVKIIITTEMKRDVSLSYLTILRCVIRIYFECFSQQ